MSVRDEWNMVCPKCGDDGDFRIEVRTWVRLFSNGTEQDGDTEWDEASACACGCGWTGTVGDAKAIYARECEVLAMSGALAK